MSITIWGAGSVGLTLGARLAHAGEKVHFVCRSADVAQKIARSGVRFEDLKSGEIWRTRATATSLEEVRAEHIANGPVLICVRNSETEPAADSLSRIAPDGCAVACVQNGLDGEALLASRFSTVIGVVYRQTCTRTSSDSVVTAGAGRVVVGLHPEGSHPAANHLAERLRAAGYDVGVSEQIGEDKWLKLCLNLMSAPNALILRDDHTGADFVAIKTKLLEEANRAIQAAGIIARSCDGRDRSLDEEIDFQRTALVNRSSARTLPLYNQVWTALRRNRPPEADTYHRRILEIAAEHGVAAPMNARILAALRDAIERSLGPECFRAADLLRAGPGPTELP